MQHLVGSGMPVLYIGGTVLKGYKELIRFVPKSLHEGHSIPWESGQRISRTIWKPVIHNHVHNKPLIFSILTQVNSVKVPASYLLETLPIITLPSKLVFFKQLFPFGLPINLLHAYREVRLNLFHHPQHITSSSNMADYLKWGKPNPNSKAGATDDKLKIQERGQLTPKMGPKLGGALLHHFLYFGPGDKRHGRIYPARYMLTRNVRLYC
jgi:hypothetical protein